jgi:hypothetical protein
MYRVLCAVALCLFLAAPVSPAARRAPVRTSSAAAAILFAHQQTAPRVESPPKPEVAKTTIHTLATTLTTTAGSSVWILNAQVEKVVSRRAFVLKSFDDDRFHPATSDSRALLVTNSDVPRIGPGTAMEVIGTVFTAAGARSQRAAVSRELRVIAVTVSQTGVIRVFHDGGLLAEIREHVGR